MIGVAITLLALAFSYTVGSIPTGLWLGLRLRGIDIRDHGSRNIGATNTLRVLGKKLGAIALLCDVFKGFLPVYLATKGSLYTAPALESILPLLCGVTAILGHSFSLFLRFKGGKGVATSAGVFLALAPAPTLAGLYAFATVLIATQMVSAGSIAAAAVMATAVLLLPFSLPVRIMTLAVALLVIYKHRSNIQRILQGVESRMWDPEKGRSAAANGLTPPNGTDYAAAILAGAGALIVYTLTLAPCVTGEDSGEFIAAAYRLGIPHPPGYPLYALVAHGFTWLPFGDVAWRVNFCSAFFMAAAAVLAALIAVLFTRSRLAGAVAAFAFAFSHEAWQQAVIAEVYGLNAFLIALALFLTLLWHTGKTRGTSNDALLRALAVVCGLGQGAHNTMTIVAPILALYIFCADGAPWRRWKFYGGLALLSIASAIAIYLYLPLRSLANPPLDWGNPETLENFWNVVRRKQFAFMFTQYPHGLLRFIHQMGALSLMWGREFAPWCIVLALLGLPVALYRRTAPALLLLFTALAVVAGFAFVQNFEQDKPWLWVMSVFGIPAYLCTSVFLGVAVQAIRELSSGARVRGVLGVIALAAVGAQAPLFWHSNDKSDFYWVHDYGENVLTSLEPNAIYISEMDHQAFSAMYWQQVRGLRTDVEVMNKYGYLDLSLVADMPQDRLDAFGPFPPLKFNPEIYTWLLRHTDRPVYFTWIPKLKDAPEIRFVPWGFTYRALRPGEPAPQGNPWDDYYTWRHPLTPEYARGDYTAELILCEAAMHHAEEAFRAGKPQEALARLEEAKTAAGADPEILHRLGQICARHRMWDPAEDYLTQALALWPHNEIIRGNLDKLRQHREQVQ